MPKFLNVPERRTCRYDSRENYARTNEINGLYTDTFSECNIVILYKKFDNNSVRISMTHADRLVGPEQIQTEIDWVSDNNTDNLLATIIVKNVPGSEAIRNSAISHLLPYFSIDKHDVRDPEKFAISIDKNGAIAFYSRENVPLLATAPNEWRFQSTFTLNLCFRTDVGMPDYQALENTGLLFDGKAWQALSKHDEELIPSARNFYTLFLRELTKLQTTSKAIAQEIVVKLTSVAHKKAEKTSCSP